MKDIIDLGNKVFDNLIDKYGELSESRTLFLYGITMGTTWFIINSTKTILIEENGIIKNFDDPIINDLNEQWKAVKFEKERRAANIILSKIKGEGHTPKDGEIYNFWQNEEPFRDLNF